jgi:hypothetical protein
MFNLKICVTNGHGYASWFCCNQNPVLFSFMTNHRVCSKSNTICATCGAGSAYPSGSPEFTCGFQCGWCCLIFFSFLCFINNICPFCLFSFVHWVICPYPVDIFKLFLRQCANEMVGCLDVNRTCYNYIDNYITGIFC